MRESTLGQLAVGRGFISRDDLGTCLREQRLRERMGGHIRLGQILVRRDLLSATELVSLLEAQSEIRDH